MQRFIPPLIGAPLRSRITVAGLFLLIAACDQPQVETPEPDSTQDPEPESKEQSPEADSQESDSSEKPDSDKSEPESESPDESGDEDPDNDDPEDESSDKENPGEEDPDKDDPDGQDPDKEDPDNDDPDKDDPDKDDPDKDDPDKSGPIPCEGEAPKVVLETNQGTIKLTLDGKRAPNTVANYIQYVNDKHYDNTIFHRVLSDFMIQGGGYDLDNKLKKDRPPIKLEIHPELKHKAGTLAMARTNDKNSATAQFYICVDDSGCKHLDGEYAAFGQTVEGLDVVKKISEVPKTKDGSHTKMSSCRKLTA